MTNNKSPFNTLKHKLEERQLELSNLLNENKADSNPVTLDQQSIGRVSRIDAIQMQAMAKEIQHRRTIELKQIEAALQRLSNNEYGYCTSCGEDISKQRLELNPTTTQCIECAN